MSVPELKGESLLETAGCPALPHDGVLALFVDWGGPHWACDAVFGAWPVAWPSKVLDSVGSPGPGPSS